MTADSSAPAGPDPQRTPPLSLVPTPSGNVTRLRRKIDLANSFDVRKEMAKVYREVRFNKLPPETGAKLTYILTQIGKQIELGEIQPRVEAIERVVGRRE